MLIKGSRVTVVDNSGGKIAEVFGILGGSKKKKSYLGEIVRVSIKECKPNTNVKKGDKFLAIIVKTTYPTQRKDGTVIKSNENAVVLLQENYELFATSISSPVAKEALIKNTNVKKLASLSKEVF